MPETGVKFRELMAVYTPNFPGFGSVMEETWIKVHSHGEAQGKAESVLRVLRARGVEVSESVQEQVMACVDLEVLETWLDRSLTVHSAEELFVEE
ncbi:hypothetical protein ACFXKY_32185 [Streptomyces canus]|uniref:hypothetical protein n=1 Tax=Streptomyces canus TaxID=58343 RepID=UPI00368BEA71